jgi:hypothetical protein
MVPFDTGDLQASGSLQIGEHDDATDIGAMGRKVGRGLRDGELAVGAGEGFGSSLGMLSQMSASSIERKPIKTYNIVYTDGKAWFVHEYEQDYKQAGEPTTSHPGSMTVPDSEGRRRGTKYLERAVNEVAPSYPDWVAKEIEATLASLKPPPAPPKPTFDARPRLVKKVK